ncbi:Dolichyl-phosphate-mannose-protein mannosyltransferase [uncultured archaeon]|nr:Dolichyl-phosphate-mannose-protein mannosyltransferase [uncultured archaeon]
MEKRKLLLIFLIILVLFGIAIRVMYLNHDFSGEETEFIKPAIAIKDTGYPIYYHSEQQPTDIFLVHPPMYIHLLAGLFTISVSETAARSINIIFSFLCALMIFFFGKKIIGGERGKMIGIISSAFFLINYYIFSSSVLIDIDVLSAFFVFGFVYFICLNYKEKTMYSLVLAGIFLFFGLANRYPIALMVYFLTGVYFLFNRDLRKGIKSYIVMGVIAVISFTLIWAIYSMVYLPGNYFFAFISHNVSFGAEQFNNFIIYVGSFLLNISQFTRLFTFPATILMFLAFFYFFKEKNFTIRVLMIYVLSILAFFVIVARPAYGYPRYFMSMFPGLSILISIFICDIFSKTRLSKKEIISVSVISFLLCLLLLILLRPQLTLYATNGLIKATNLPDFIINILCSIPLVLVFLAKSSKRKEIFVLMLIALSLSYSFYFDLGLLMHNSHIKEAAKYLEERTGPEDTIIVPKAIGYYSNRKFYVNENNKPELDFSAAHLKEYIVKSFENPTMDDSFFWPKELFSGTSFYGINPTKEDLNKASYIILYHQFNDNVPEKKIGDFYIYNLKNLEEN